MSLLGAVVCYIFYACLYYLLLTDEKVVLFHENQKLFAGDADGER